MRETYRSPLFRCFVCLILVCCILVNLSPVQAEALPLSTWVWLEASMVFASLFAGLGVSPVDELADGFADACNNCWDFISLNYDFVTDDQKIAVWATGTDELPFMIDQDLVEAVRDWLFSNEVIKEDKSNPGWAYYNNFAFRVIPDAPEGYPYSAIFLNPNNSLYYCYFTDTPFLIYRYSSGALDFRLRNSTSGKSYFYTCSISNIANGWTNKSSNDDSPAMYGYDILWSNHDVVNYSNSAEVLFLPSEPTESILSADDQKYLTNYIAPSSEDFTTGYSDWAAGAISVPGIRSKEEAEELVVPLSIPGTVADVYSFAQTDVWTGAITAADVIAQAIPITGTDTPTPDPPDTPDVPENLQAYTFDLRDFFPFCIPFDLYDFFSVLHAPPEAPKFHWDIQDTSGRTYSIDVDLSSWDNVASFFRKLQLFLFITGLAAASRKYIKW